MAQCSLRPGAESMCGQPEPQLKTQLTQLTQLSPEFNRASFEVREDEGMRRSGSMGRWGPGFQSKPQKGIQSQPSTEDERAAYKEWLAEHPCVLEQLDNIKEGLRGRRLAVFLDYDGTLTPIVPNPDEAVLDRQMREVVRRVAALFPTAIISGRGRDKVEAFVQLKELCYAGSHGMDIAGPQIGLNGAVAADMAFQPAAHFKPLIDRVYTELRSRLAGIPGSSVEHNNFCVSAHFRNCSSERWQEVVAVVEEIVAVNPELLMTRGRKVVEIRPKVAWHKGTALDHLLGVLGLRGAADVVALYIGDDHTDEDAFKVLNDTKQGFGVLVSTKIRDTAASYTVRDPSEVQAFLQALIAWGETEHNGWLFNSAGQAINPHAAPSAHGTSSQQQSSLHWSQPQPHWGQPQPLANGHAHPAGRVKPGHARAATGAWHATSGTGVVPVVCPTVGGAVAGSRQQSGTQGTDETGSAATGAEAGAQPCGVAGNPGASSSAWHASGGVTPGAAPVSTCAEVATASMSAWHNSGGMTSGRASPHTTPEDAPLRTSAEVAAVAASTSAWHASAVPAAAPVAAPVSISAEVAAAAASTSAWRASAVPPDVPVAAPAPVRTSVEMALASTSAWHESGAGSPRIRSANTSVELAATSASAWHVSGGALPKAGSARSSLDAASTSTWRGSAPGAKSARSSAEIPQAAPGVKSARTSVEIATPGARSAWHGSAGTALPGLANPSAQAAAALASAWHGIASTPTCPALACPTSKAVAAAAAAVHGSAGGSGTSGLASPSDKWLGNAATGPANDSPNALTPDAVAVLHGSESSLETVHESETPV